MNEESKKKYTGLIQCCYCKTNNIDFLFIKFYNKEEGSSVAYGCDNCKNYAERADRN